MFTSDSSIPLNCLSQKLCMLTTNLSFIFLKPNTVSRHWKLYSTITWGISTNRSPSSSDVWCCQDHGWDQYFLPDLSRPVSDGVWCCYKTLRKVNLCEISQEMCKGQGEFYDGFRPKVTCTLAEATRVFHIAYKLLQEMGQNDRVNWRKLPSHARYSQEELFTNCWRFYSFLSLSELL